MRVGIRKGALFVMRDMQVIWSMEFPCLLVCQSAIFIDSKRDGSVLLDERFRPTVKTEWPHASAVNGIYPEDVADLPTIETAIPRLREIFAGADEIIGYNVGFDLGFLSAVGVRPREDAIITDTMKLFTWFMGRRYKLVDAADHIGYEWTGRAHGSLADALATLAVQRWLEQWLVAE